MTEQQDDKDRPRDGTGEYSASKAPETAHEAEGESARGDSRLLPGGEHGSRADIGMSAMDRADVPSGAEDPGQMHLGRED